MDQRSALLCIYDTVTDPQGWQHALDSIAAVAGACAGALLVRDHGPTPFSVSALSSRYRVLEDSGQAEYYMRNLAHLEGPQWAFISRMPTERIERDEDMGVPLEDLDARADYVFLRDAVGMRRRLAFRLNSNQGWFDGVTLGFPEAVSRIPESALHGLHPLLPHMAKAVEIGRMFNHLKTRYNAILSMLDRIGIGLMLAVDNGEILVANTEADRILSLEDGLRRSPARGLVVSQPDLSAALAHQIKAACETASGKGKRAAQYLTIPRPSGQHPFLVEVLPLRDGKAEFGEILNGALVIVVDPDNSRPLDIAAFARLHQLTAAEASVCEHLVLGHQAREIAEMRATSLATSRNQIAAVYAKTGVRHRGDLIRLVIRTLPPIL